MNERSAEPMNQESIWSLAIAIGLIVFGLSAIALSYPFGIGLATVLSWIVLLAGISHLAMRWKTSTIGAVLGRIIIGLAYIAGAAYLFADPHLSVTAIVRLFAIIVFVEGIALVTMYLRNRARAAAAWILIDGIATLLFAGLIWTRWPDGMAWTVGAILGANIVVSGVAALMISLAGRASPRRGARRSKSSTVDAARGSPRR